MTTTFPLVRKKMPFSRLRAGLGFGLLLLAILVAGSSYADAVSPAGAPLSTLVKFADRDYEVTAEGWVSLDPVSTANVRKIGYGRVTEVNIATTSTGTYSSDGMVSPHILYPGISVRPAPMDQAGSHLAWRRIPGTYISTFGRTPSGARIFQSSSPRGSSACMIQRGSSICTFY